MRRLLACLAVVWFSGVACATRPAPNVTPDQAKLQQAAKFAVAIERTGRLVKGLQDAEIAFYNAGRISREDHRVFHISAKIAAETVLDALQRMQDPAQTEITRRQWASVALGAVDRLVNEGLIPMADQQARMELQLLSTAITSILVTLQLTADAEPPFVTFGEVAWLV